MAKLTDFLKLCKYSITAEPTWGKDAGRENMLGDFSGTFLGYFTNITLSFGKTTQEEMTSIKNVFEKATFNFTYPSDKTGKDVTELFYGTAIKAEKNKLNGLYLPFEFTIVAVHRRD